MRLKEWIKKTEAKMRDQDYMNILYIRKIGRTEQTRQLFKTDLKQYPLLLEADVVKQDEYESEYMSFSLNMKCTGQGKCIQYTCWIDSDEARIALNLK